MELASMRKPLTWAFAGCLALSLGAGMAGCSSSDSGSSSDTKAEQQADSNKKDGVTQVNITLKENKVEVDTTEVEAGPVTFTVTNESAPGISECELLYNQKIVGEKENLAPGLDSVSFTVTLNGGDYKIYCPGADNSYTEFKVTGEAAAAPAGSAQDIMQEGVKEYAQYRLLATLGSAMPMRAAVSFRASTCSSVVSMVKSPAASSMQPPSSRNPLNPATSSRPRRIGPPPAPSTSMLSPRSTRSSCPATPSPRAKRPTTPTSSTT